MKRSEICQTSNVTINSCVLIKTKLSEAGMRILTSTWSKRLLDRWILLATWIIIFTQGTSTVYKIRFDPLHYSNKLRAPEKNHSPQTKSLEGPECLLLKRHVSPMAHFSSNWIIEKVRILIAAMSKIVFFKLLVTPSSRNRNDEQPKTFKMEKSGSSWKKSIL